MSRLSLLSASLGLAAFLFVPLSRVSGQECFSEDFEAATDGQLVTEPPLNWSPFLGPNTKARPVIAGLHADLGWTGKAVRGDIMFGGGGRNDSVYKVIPGLNAGAQKGIWTIRYRGYFDKEKTGDGAGIHFCNNKSTGDFSGVQVASFQYNRADSRWYLAAPGVGLVKNDITLGTDTDIDVELEVDFDTGVVTARVFPHGDSTELFNLSGTSNRDPATTQYANFYSINSIQIQNHYSAAQPAGVDADDIKVISSVGCSGTDQFERFCTNGIDDDGDGFKDCDDVQCAAEAICVKEICDNESDDNGDKLTDCNDPGCATAEICNCTNGLDDDNKNGIDCADPACQGRADGICNPLENCTGGGDEDGDAKTNCADPDCSADPTCTDVNACFEENFDGPGYTPGKTLRELGWIPYAENAKDRVIAPRLHGAWIGNAVNGRPSVLDTSVGGALHYYKPVPGLKAGAQTGIWTLRYRAWFNRELSGDGNGIGFAVSQTVAGLPWGNAR